MTVEVVAQKATELISGLDVGARVDHVATGQGLVEGGVVSAIELVHHDLPHGVALAGAVVRVTVALVGHPEVERVGPDGHASQRGGDGGVVDKELVGHHLELLVAADAEVRGAHADDAAVGDVGETLDDEAAAGHLGQPVVVAAVGPVLGVVAVGQRENGDLVTFAVQVLDGRVVGVLVVHEEGGSDLAAVGVLALAVEEVLVQVDVVDVDGTVEGERDHLGHLAGLNVAGDASAISRAEAVGEHALGRVAVGRTVRVSLNA